MLRGQEFSDARASERVAGKSWEKRRAEAAMSSKLLKDARFDFFALGTLFLWRPHRRRAVLVGFL
jgi:hypothetical protein